MSLVIDVNFGNSLNEICKKIVAFFIKYPEPINTEKLILKLKEEGIIYGKRHIYKNLKTLRKAKILTNQPTNWVVKPTLWGFVG